MALSAEKYRELFKLRAEGKLEPMECTKSLFKLLQPIFKPNTKLLDVPCGVGHYLSLLKELGDFSYYGVDLDSKAVEMAKDVWKERPNTFFDVQSVNELKFEDGFFDVVVCYNLILHLGGYKEAITELFRVSKKYVVIRSLFGDIPQKNDYVVSKDYSEVYKDGICQYNTYLKDEIQKFVSSLGPCKVKFIPDRVDIPANDIKKQSTLLAVPKEEFASSNEDKTENFKGLNLNYSVLFIEKQRY